MPTSPPPAEVLDPITPSNALVTFLSGSVRIYLSECQITRRGGLSPDVWTAVVPYTELVKLGLGDVSGEVAGTVELWYSDAPPDTVEDESGAGGVGTAPARPSPDVSLGNVAIVDVSKLRLGREPGETADKTVIYRIAIADHRRAWVAPRGGVLFDGLINPDPDPSGATPITNADLIGRCTTAMGVTATIATSVEEAGPIYNLRWDGAHAPSELQRLLEHTGMVFAPLIAGQAQIVKPGTATPPTIPSGRLIRSVVTSCIDRRSGTAVFTSCPAPKIHSWNDQGGTGKPTPPTWKYVALDPSDGKWKPLNNITGAGGDAAQTWKNDFKDVDATDRAALKAQWYRSIQLDKTKYPPRSVRLLPIYIGVDLKRSPARLSNADLLTVQNDGSYFAAGVDGEARAEKIIPEENIIIFEQPLMKIASGTQKRRMTLSPEEVCIPEATLKPWCSVEAWDTTTNSREYGIYGANVSGGVVAAISAATAKTFLKGYRPGVSIFNAPDLINVLLNGGTTTDDRNTEAMQTRANKYASSALGVSTPALREMLIKGFYAVEIDAAVSEVTYDPRGVTTTILCNGWHVASRTGEGGGGFGGGG